LSGGDKAKEQEIGKLPYDQVVLLVRYRNAESYAEADLHEKLAKRT